MSGEELAAALGTKADSLQVMTGTPDQPETDRKRSHVKRKEQIKPGR